MKLRKISGLLPAACMSIAIVGCGGGPNIDKVKQDFDSPSGSVNDKQGVAAVSGKMEASSSALSALGGGVPGAGLTASGYSRGLDRIAALRMHNRPIQSLYGYVKSKGTSIQALSEAQLGNFGDFGNDTSDGTSEGCEDSAEAQQAYQKLTADLLADAATGGSSASASTSFTLDVATCSGGDLTGSVKIDYEFEISSNGANGGSFFFKVNEELINVCETAGNKSCVSGTLLIQASASGASNIGSLETIAAWDLTATENGETIQTKGGIRFSASGGGTTGAFKVEYLFYAKSSSGAEVSYVLEISASSSGEGTGTVTLKYRGSDGTIDCTVNADGSGRCYASGQSGTATLEWTAGEADEFAKD